ncbi:MAG: ATP synthase F1 subunit gamma [Bacillota bacterium]|nr:ATP synthase F1 subunit gamma [Bacillota bacterium]
MAGAGLVAIKRRIKSISNTKKITKAMGLIATSKLRKSRQQVESNRAYFNSFNEVAAQVAQGVTTKSIYVNGNNSDKSLYIAINSDTGLCGAFNGNVVSRTSEEIEKSKKDSSVMVVGQKGRLYFRRLKYNTVAEYVDISDEPTLKEAQMIANHALDLYDKGEVGEVYAVYTEFVSTVKQTVTVKKLLPLEIKKQEKAESKVSPLIDFEPGIDGLLGDIVRLQLNQMMYNFLANSRASEQASRMSAMDGATKNANDLLDNLNLQYNRIRQSAITQEISEIVSGAEAQK